ncbi:hypothetical protein HK096_001236, partial [Nowakowskiella sp. JEL0078]
MAAHSARAASSKNSQNSGPKKSHENSPARKKKDPVLPQTNNVTTVSDENNLVSATSHVLM